MTFPPTSASLLFVGVSTFASMGLAGATVAISPSAGSTVTYGDVSQVSDDALTATSTSGTAYIGDLPPGMYDVTVTATPAVTCSNLNTAQIPQLSTPHLGGHESSTADASVRAPTFAGATTVVFLRCM